MLILILGLYLLLENSYFPTCLYHLLKDFWNLVSGPVRIGFVMNLWPNKGIQQVPCLDFDLGTRQQTWGQTKMGCNAKSKEKERKEVWRTRTRTRKRTSCNVRRKEKTEKGGQDKECRKLQDESERSLQWRERKCRKLCVLLLSGHMEFWIAPLPLVLVFSYTRLSGAPYWFLVDCLYNTGYWMPWIGLYGFFKGLLVVKFYS